jgi:hypothetical protein
MLLRCPRSRQTNQPTIHPTTHCNRNQTPQRAARHFLHHHGLTRAEEAAKQLRTRLARLGLLPPKAAARPFDLDAVVRSIAAGMFFNAAQYERTEADVLRGEAAGAHVYRLLRHAATGAFWFWFCEGGVPALACCGVLVPRWLTPTEPLGPRKSTRLPPITISSPDPHAQHYPPTHPQTRPSSCASTPPRSSGACGPS